MIIHPELRALRGDDTPQRDAQQALLHSIDRWRTSAGVAAALAELEAFAGGRPLAQCPALATLFDEGDDAARDLALGFAAETATALLAVPLGHVRLRHFTDGVLSTLLLARSGNVTLSLVAIDGDGLRSRPAPVTVDFSPSEIRERVLAGSAAAERIECLRTDERRAELKRVPVALRPGQAICRDAGREALQIREVTGCLVSLRLQRRRAMADATREYRLTDGELVHQAAGNPRDSRVELMMALLGRMARADAAPLLAEIAREEGSAALRWQALREALSLDTAVGFQALTAIARSQSDALAPAAGALRSQLVETYPQLAGVEPCPA